MTQTAVEWLEKILKGQKEQPFDDYEWEIAFNHAKEMEKEQSLSMSDYNLEELADEYYKQFDNLPVVRYNAYVAGFQKALELLTFKSE